MATVGHLATGYIFRSDGVSYIFIFLFFDNFLNIFLQSKLSTLGILVVIGVKLLEYFLKADMWERWEEKMGGVNLPMKNKVNTNRVYHSTSHTILARKGRK